MLLSCYQIFHSIIDMKPMQINTFRLSFLICMRLMPRCGVQGYRTHLFKSWWSGHPVGYNLLFICIVINNTGYFHLSSARVKGQKWYSPLCIFLWLWMTLQLYKCSYTFQANEKTQGLMAFKVNSTQPISISYRSNCFIISSFPFFL